MAPMARKPLNAGIVIKKLELPRPKLGRLSLCSVRIGLHSFAKRRFQSGEADPPTRTSPWTYKANWKI